MNPVPDGGHSGSGHDAPWTIERALTWLAQSRALTRVRTTEYGEAEVFVSVRPSTHPDDVLVVRRPCSQDAPLLDIAAAIEQAACALLADGARRTLRVVTDEAERRVTDQPPSERAGSHVEWDLLDTPPPASPGGRP